MVDQNKTANYLKYAFGEVFLVVIGILIALQINNWNEQRKLDASQERILQGLVQSLEADVEACHGSLRSLERFNKSIKLLMMPPVFHDSLTIHFVRTLNGINLTLLTSSFEQLQSLGMDRIQNAVLRDSVVKYYDERVPESLFGIEENLSEFLKTYQYPFYEDNFLFISSDTSFSQVTYLPRDYELLIDDPKFHSILVEKWIFNMQTRESVIKPLIEHSNRLIAQIEEELDR